eukprot:6730458-Pyramimonas_sp.AAC.1
MVHLLQSEVLLIASKGCCELLLINLAFSSASIPTSCNFGTPIHPSRLTIFLALQCDESLGRKASEWTAAGCEDSYRSSI